MNKGGSQKVGDVTFTMTHAVHSCGILDDGKIIYGGEAAGYVLRFPDGRALYFAGDTNVFSDMQLIEQLYHPELAFLPIGDLYTMSPREAALACRLLKAEESGAHALRHLPAAHRPARRIAQADFRPRHRSVDARTGQAVEW